MVLVAAPLLAGVAAPFMKPLHRRQSLERSRNSELTSMATDIVGGLRILRGIGGERTFGANYTRQSRLAMDAGVSAGIWQALIEALGVLFSGVFLVLLMWVGAHEVLAGRVSVGDLVAFLGYALFMVTPIQTFFEFAQKITRALVSARKAIAIYEQRPPWVEPDVTTALDASQPLTDDASGLTIRPGELTIVVSAVPEESAALADRLGRYLPPDTDPVSTEIDESLKGAAARRERRERAERRAEITRRDAERSREPWGAPGRGGPARRHSSGRTPHRPRLRHQLATLRRHPARGRRPAPPAHPRAGGDGAARRQRRGRVRRAAGRRAGHHRRAGPRAVRRPAPAHRPGPGARRDALILVLVEPTSAVDAHTEARIAERVLDLRRGRTTVVCTVSPLWLHHADRVVLLDEGRVVLDGTHDELMQEPAYRRVVVRDLDGEVTS